MSPLELRRLLLELIETSSVTGSEARFCNLLYRFLQKEFKCDRLEKQSVSKGRFNIILSNGKPRCTLSTHVDTVPTKVRTAYRDGVVYGVGACDAKGQLVTQISALKKAIHKGLSDYACFFVVGEEVASDGAQRIASAAKISSKYLVNGEPTNNRFTTNSRGVVECLIESRGVLSHSSLHPLQSAVHNLVGDLDRLLSVLTSENTSVNIGTIEGGVASNVSADAAQATICVRSSLLSNRILPQIKKCLKKSSLKILNVIEPMSFYVPSGHEKNAVSVFFSSDARYYTEKFEKVMLFGPGKIKDAHTDHENIKLSDIDAGAQILSNLLLTL